MPFQSEKQRRFLWLKHPDIAKRWAHEYPKSNKNLPMYANEDKEEPKDTDSKKVKEKVAGRIMDACAVSQLPANFEQILKNAASKAVQIDMPHTDKPIAAGDNSIMAEKTDQNKNTKPCTHECDVKSAQNVLNKLGAVLGERLMQEIAEQQAAETGAPPAPVPQNAGWGDTLKRYAMPSATTQLPMGMQQPQQPMAPAQPMAPQQPVAPEAPKMAAANMGGSIQAIKPMYSMSQQRRMEAQQQAQKQQNRSTPQYAPVGGGNQPNANPINMYGGLSTDPTQYGTPNAAFGTANSAEKQSMANALAKWAADTPAWQRDAGQNDEGGLNAKGRASYNNATGGNLKPPVTESNPTGERKSRRASFCARMGGMKKKLTGEDTANDPDSRINKALRKWNC